MASSHGGPLFSFLTADGTSSRDQPEKPLLNRDESLGKRSVGDPIGMSIERCHPLTLTCKRALRFFIAKCTEKEWNRLSVRVGFLTSCLGSVSFLRSATMSLAQFRFRFDFSLRLPFDRPRD